MSLQVLGPRPYFWQWDSGQKLEVTNTNCGEVHFCNGTGDCALVVKIKTEADGTRTVDVPNILLQTANPIRAYLFQRQAETEAQTVTQYNIQVLERPRPDDYVYTETEVLNYATLKAELDYIMENVEVGPEGDGDRSVQVDLAQNDPSQPDYVKNRTHWVEEGLVEILPDSIPRVVQEFAFPVITENVPTLEIGKTYMVKWNGVEYEVEGKDLATASNGQFEGVFIGNPAALGGTNSGEPFALGFVTAYGAIGVMPLDGATNITVSISQREETIHKIDNKFIDAEWMAKDVKEDIIYFPTSTVVAPESGSYSAIDVANPSTGEKVRYYNLSGWNISELTYVDKIPDAEDMFISANGVKTYGTFCGEGADGDLKYVDYWFDTPTGVMIVRWVKTETTAVVWNVYGERYKTYTVSIGTEVTNVPLLPEKFLPVDYINSLIDTKLEDIPSGDPTPMQPLTFTGAVNATYDGSTPVTVDIPSGGGGEAELPILQRYTLEEAINRIDITGLPNLTEFVLEVLWDWQSTAQSGLVRFALNTGTNIYTQTMSISGVSTGVSGGIVCVGKPIYLGGKIELTLSNANSNLVATVNAISNRKSVDVLSVRWDKAEYTFPVGATVTLRGR